MIIILFFAYRQPNTRSIQSDERGPLDITEQSLQCRRFRTLHVKRRERGMPTLQTGDAIKFRSGLFPATR